MPALPGMPSPAPPPAPRVAPLVRCSGAPGTLIPAVIGPVQRICEGLTPVSGSEHDTYDEFRGTEVSTFAQGYGGRGDGGRFPGIENPE
jgi:hypothetical protein